ncbi:MAG: tRNA (adenosine(37)-N6)-dimethylallyltransferase MiaA [Proteobacteria bacterium]|nr:tRNA (adenosine(37)-N6)-dimethylallyltransferase MiaA [Pseudomonadota bacterium]MBU2226968.1 tRNA (adenosine(37)-N6)-dimethylallyltransferase MiaA [Pseudomonadota bacterium]MBU2261773.1 tRNA (adenosine(37)-N6)-dimethylallyltransferase MiaA [Pseudomonadota bacterium]
MIDSGAVKPRLIVIMGPTGVGKTAMAMELAGRRKGEIVSADSMQVYRGMDIGTAKPTAEERDRIPHHLLDVVDPDEPFHASRYCGLAHGVIARLLGEKKTVFVVGGTGLYIRALLGGLIDGPGGDEFLRRALKEEMERAGKEALYERLLKGDPKAAARINPRDGVRIIRALEVLELTGRSIVDHQDDHRFREQPYEALRIGLALDRERLQARIDRRTDQMIADGLVEEVRRLSAMGYGLSLKSMQSLGYRHIAACLAGRTDLAEAVRLIKRDTYRYAKRQMTWFRAERGVVWLAPDAVETAEERIGSFLDRE